MQMVNIEKKAKDLFKNHVLGFMFFILLTLSFVIRISGIPCKSGDYMIFLQPWFNQIKSGGGFLALGTAIGDYNVPYMMIMTALTYIPLSPLITIKAISIVFDYAAAGICGLIVYRLLKPESEKRAEYSAVIAFFVVLFLPTVVLNSSFWGQCDSIYTSFLLLCIYYFIREKYSLAFIFFAVAFAFKLQAVFLLPLLVIVYFVRNKFSFYNFLLIPVVYYIMICPALFAGRPIMQTLFIYVNQTGTYESLTNNYPNLYVFLNGDYKVYQIFAVCITFGILGLLFLHILYHKFDVSPKNLVSLSLLTVFICVFFLPAMHDRYGYILDMLSVVYYAVNRKKIYIPIAINFISLTAYISFLLKQDAFDAKFIALGNMIVLVLLAIDVLADLRKDNADIEKTDDVIVVEKEESEKETALT